MCGFCFCACANLPFSPPFRKAFLVGPPKVQTRTVARGASTDKRDRNDGFLRHAACGDHHRCRATLCGLFRLIRSTADFMPPSLVLAALLSGRADGVCLTFRRRRPARGHGRRSAGRREADQGLGQRSDSRARGRQCCRAISPGARNRRRLADPVLVFAAS